MFRYGLVIGKFMPLHKGHVGMLRFAKNLCQELEVSVSADPGRDIIPVETRASAIETDVFPKETEEVEVTVTIFEDKRYHDAPRDEDGTVTDEGYWKWYIEELKSEYPKGFYPDVIISSDLYGKEIAKRLGGGTRWIPYDPEREMTSGLSATAIKSGERGYSEMAPSMRSLYSKTVVILGPESSGKSTLAKSIAETFGGTYVPEYGRTIDVFKGGLDKKDFEVIGKAQEYLIQDARNDERMLTVVDTEAFTTQIYADKFLHERLSSLDYLAEKQRGYVNKYILLPPEIPFDDDGTRTMASLEERKEVFETLKAYCVLYDLPYYIPKQTNLLARTFEVWDFIKGE